jgi:hypothetical protein
MLKKFLFADLLKVEVANFSTGIHDDAMVWCHESEPYDVMLIVLGKNMAELTVEQTIPCFQLNFRLQMGLANYLLAGLRIHKHKS